MIRTGERGYVAPLAYARASARPVSKRMPICFIGMLITPPIVFSLFIVLEHRFASSPSQELLFAFGTWGLSLVSGLLFVHFLPLRRWVRVLIGCIYTPILLYSLFIYGLVFAGYVYDEWL